MNRGDIVRRARQLRLAMKRQVERFRAYVEDEWDYVFYIADEHTVTFWFAWIGIIATTELVITALFWLTGS